MKMNRIGFAILGIGLLPMQKNNRYAAPVLVLGLALAASGLVTQQAASLGAVVINNDGCVLLDGDGNLYGTDQGHQVITKNGNANLKCEADNVPNSTGNIVWYDAYNNPYATPVAPLPCMDAFGDLTLDWKEVVTPSGQASLVCHFS